MDLDVQNHEFISLAEPDPTADVVVVRTMVPELRTAETRKDFRSACGATADYFDLALRLAFPLGRLP